MNILKTMNVYLLFKIQTRFEFGVKLSSVIRICLGLSANQLNRLIEAKAIFSPEGYSLKKHKVKDGDVVLVNKHIAGMF